MSEELKRLRAELEAQIKQATDERVSIVGKAERGEKLTLNENRRNHKLAKEIKKIQARLDKYASIDLYDELLKKVEKLGKKNTPADEKQAITSELISEFNKMNKEAQDKLKEDIKLSKDEVDNIEDTKEKYNNKLKGFNAELEMAERRKFRTRAIKKDIKKAKKASDIIDEFFDTYLKDDKIDELLGLISNENTPSKEKTKAKQTVANFIEAHKKVAIEKILEKKKKMNILRKKTAEESKGLSEKSKKAGLVIGGISATAILLAVIIAFISSYNKKNSSSKSDDLENTTNTTKVEQGTLEIASSDLDNKIYKEVAERFNIDEETAKELVDEALAVSTEEEISNLTEQAVSMTEDGTGAFSVTERTFSIAKSGLFDTNEYSIEDIAEIVDAVDDKTLFTSENAHLAQAFNTAFNRITDHYLFGEVTEEDILKLDGLQNFAKEGSDLDKFLTRFTSLAKSILMNPEDENAKDEMYSFLYIFTTSLNGFTNEPSSLTGNETFNEAAQINDYFDWYIAYNSFVKPLYPIYSNDKTFAKLEELQGTMETAMEGLTPYVCGQSRKLGGE